MSAIYWFGVGVIVAIGCALKIIFHRLSLFIVAAVALTWPVIIAALIFAIVSHAWRFRKI